MASKYVRMVDMHIKHHTRLVHMCQVCVVGASLLSRTLALDYRRREREQQTKNKKKTFNLNITCDKFRIIIFYYCYI